uniref:Uncharacterized protein n=1 Tax=Solanum tuberosum TaxID=4113 RepID=M1AL17_SOLTU
MLCKLTLNIKLRSSFKSSLRLFHPTCAHARRTSDKWFYQIIPSTKMHTRMIHHTI